MSITLLALGLLSSPAAPASLDASWWNTWGTLISCNGVLHLEYITGSGPIVVELAFTASFQEGDQVYVIGVGGSGGTTLCSPERVDYMTISDFEPIVATCPCTSAISCSGTGAPYGCPNSTGQGGLLGYDGAPTVGSSFFRLDLYASRLPAGSLGLVFMGNAGAPPSTMGDGLLCVGGPVLQRFPPRVADASGRLAELDVSGTSAGFHPSARIVIGSTWHFQCAYRDLNGPCGGGFNLTNGLQVTFLR